MGIQLYKSTNHGSTWSFAKTVSTAQTNDREMIAIDNNKASKFKDHIYVVWDVPGQGMRFTRSTDHGASFSAIQSLSTDVALGTDLAIGPQGEIYVVWPDVQSKQIKVRKSVDGGATFSAVKTIATTSAAFKYFIPAQCARGAAVYVSVAVDKSSGPGKGKVYVTWPDQSGGTTPAQNACTAAQAASSKVFVSSSKDGQAWSAAKQVQATAKADQFNPWLDVDPTTGTVHLAYYDTKDDATRKKTRLYYTASTDQAATWSPAKRVASQAGDETTAGADGNQIGDYSGLAAFGNVAIPLWTSRKGGPTDVEQVFTAKVVGPKAPPPLCAKAEQLTVARFGQYQETTLSLPPDQRAALDALAARIAASFAKGCKPIRTVKLEGHSDFDAAKTRKFELDLSRKRAEQVKAHLVSAVGKNAAKVKFTIKALGSTAMPNKNPATTEQHEENRRVAIAMAP